MEREIKKAKGLAEMLNDKELKALEIIQLSGIRNNVNEIKDSIKLLADEYVDDFSNYVESEMLFEIMEKSGILEEDDGDLVIDKMKEIIINKLSN